MQSLGTQVPDIQVKKCQNGSVGWEISPVAMTMLEVLALSMVPQGFGTNNGARAFAATKVQKTLLELEAPMTLLVLGNGSSVDDGAGTNNDGGQHQWP